MLSIPETREKTSPDINGISLNKIETQNENLIIEENGRHQYSKDYKKLTREFYTIFD